MKLLVPWLNRTEIKKAADDINTQFNPQREIPVPIETMVERDFNIDIVPFAGLKEELENDGFLARDFTTIHIDQYVYFNVEVRYRFSLAHELGHLVLHRQAFRDLAVDSVEEWADMYDSIDEDDSNKLEFQANSFAGYLLIPDFALSSRFAEVLRDIGPLIAKAKESGIERETYTESALGTIARKLAPGFNVSVSCMENRLKNDEAYRKLMP